MVDFSKLVGRKGAPDLRDPLKLFDSLDRKASHISLRPAQTEALKELHARQLERDVILKMPTGTGKSTVGLLYAKSRMAEKKRPGAYLCPTKQLVEQVLEEAARVGIPAHGYPAGEPHPHNDCLRGEAVIVCTYDKLFNAKTTFDREDVNITPVALVLDDAHAGIEVIREQFTVACSDPTIRRELFKVVDGACAAYQPGYWADIKAGRREAVLQIPHWLWAPIVDDVRKVLAAHADDPSLKFKWPWVRDVLRWCRCVVAADGAEIVPEILPVRLVRAYDTAEHRLFMSATLADDAVLVRELGCSADAALKPVVAGAEAGMGERMVLVPSLIDRRLDRTWLMPWAQKKSAQARVVVLSASEKAAREWQSHGAEVVVGDEVSEVVTKLRDGRVNFVAFAQRYDGIDLADDACRVLIIDGMPTGQGITDRYDSARLGVHAGVRNRIGYRIEQGMGRAVRSNADYAVVILAGPELASFTAKGEVRELMSAEARAQLELGQELAQLARNESGSRPEDTFDGLVNKSLKRDQDWKSYYGERVRAAVTPGPPTDEVRVRIADAERRAAIAAHDGDPAEAVRILQALLDETVPETDAAVRGRVLQSMAGYMHEFDPATAVGIQKAAYEKNRAMLRPPTGALTRPPEPSKVEAASRIIAWVRGFDNANGAIVEFQALATGLSFAVGAERLEQALKDLAEIIGAEGLRPDKEFGQGPDNLMLWDAFSLVIEAKNEARYDAISKSDVGQLHNSMAWFTANYSGREAVPVMVVAAEAPEPGAVLPTGTRLIRPEDLRRLVIAVGGFVAALIAKVTSGGLNVKEVGILVHQFGLDPKGLVQRFTTEPKQAKLRRN